MKITDRGPRGLDLCTVSKALHLTFDPQNGSGQWLVRPAVGTSIVSSGWFTIDEHGRVKLDDAAAAGPLEMDAAAEALMARIL